MELSQIYIIISIVVLAVIALLVFFVAREGKRNQLTPLAGLAFGFVLAGILFGADRILGYSLMGIGIVIACVDMYRRSKQN